MQRPFQPGEFPYGLERRKNCEGVWEGAIVTRIFPLPDAGIFSTGFQLPGEVRSVVVLPGRIDPVRLWRAANAAEFSITQARMGLMTKVP